MASLRKKTEPKQCPLGTVWKNGALFSTKGTKTVPLWQSSPHQKGTIVNLFLENGALRALFWKTVPFWWGGGTVLMPFLPKRAPFFETVPKGHCFGSVFFLSDVLILYLCVSRLRILDGKRIHWRCTRVKNLESKVLMPKTHRSKVRKIATNFVCFWAEISVQSPAFPGPKSRPRVQRFQTALSFHVHLYESSMFAMSVI